MEFETVPAWYISYCRSCGHVFKDTEGRYRYTNTYEICEDCNEGRDELYRMPSTA